MSEASLLYHFRITSLPTRKRAPLFHWVKFYTCIDFSLTQVCSNTQEKHSIKKMLTSWKCNFCSSGKCHLESKCGKKNNKKKQRWQGQPPHPPSTNIYSQSHKSAIICIYMGFLYKTSHTLLYLTHFSPGGDCWLWDERGWGFAVSALTSWTAAPTQPPLRPLQFLSSNWSSSSSSRVFITRKSCSIFHWLLLRSLCILSGYPGIWSLTTIRSIKWDECHFPPQLQATQEDV